MNINKTYPHNDFIKVLCALPPEQVLGVARVLNVKVMADKEKKIPREGEEIANDIINKYASLNRKQRRNLLKIMKQAVKE